MSRKTHEMKLQKYISSLSIKLQEKQERTAQRDLWLKTVGYKRLSI